mmetsp:Transcript_2393/g.3101  ORF Transcript_2393/g.3101 Transcript_2393/m.3101 type:complete len:96 (+) Transcript_2393:1649-1936(+)
MISYYLKDESLFDSFMNCRRIYKLFKDLITLSTTDVHWIYYYGYQKYTMGYTDSALLIFSFAAMNGHKEAIRAASYIWKNNLTKKLTCRLGSHLL